MSFLSRVLFWYTFVVLTWAAWFLFLIGFLMHHERSVWLKCQISVMLALVCTYFFEKERMKYKQPK